MRLELVAFDLYGTLLDVSGLAKGLEPYAGPQAADLLSAWREAQLERTWREKAYEPFDVVTARALEEVAPRLGAQDRLRMCETWLSLPPFPDARAALESLGRARIRRAVLSNGTPGMIRAAAITHARAGAEKIWAGTVIIHPNAKTGAHHHGPVESVLYVVRGRARMRWGERLEYTAEAGPGDFIYVPPYVPHQEINASREQPLECVVIRSGQEPVVVNLDIAPVEPPAEVKWIDPIHRS